MRRAIAVAALLAGAIAHAADGSWIAAAGDLPAEVRAAAAAAAASAEQAPERRLEAARLGARPRHEAPYVETGLDGAWTIDWTGRHGVHASARATLRLVDPARRRDAGETALQLRAARLDARLSRQEAATTALRTWILAWRAQQRLRLVRIVRALRPPGAPEARRERERWLSDEPLLELASARLARELGRATGGAALPALPFDAWDRFANGAIRACPDGDVGLVLARRHAAATRRRATLRRESLARPSVAVSLSADVGVPDLAAPLADLGARVALAIGAPAAWPFSGRVRAETDASGTSLSLEARSEAAEPARPWGLEIAAADAAVAEARGRAEDRSWFDHAQWRRAVERLRELGPPLHAPATYDEARSAWERVDLVAHAADLRSRLALACAIERGVGPSPAF
jgi:hypothetical protein